MNGYNLGYFHFLDNTNVTVINILVVRIPPYSNFSKFLKVFLVFCKKHHEFQDFIENSLGTLPQGGV